MFECFMASPSIQRNMEEDQLTFISPRGLYGKVKSQTFV